MLSNIKTKTLAAFGVIILISLGITTVLIMNTAKIAENTQRFYQEPYTGVDAVWSLRRNFLDNQRALYKFLSVSQENKEQAGASIQKSLNENNQSLVKTLDELKIICTDKGDEVNRLLNALAEAQVQETSLQNEIVQLTLNNNVKQASNLLQTSYEPLFDEISSNVLLLFDAAEADAQTFVADAMAGKRNAILFGITLSFVLLVVSVISIILYVKAIISPLREVGSVAHQMACGNLSVADQITYQADDEIGLLANFQKEMSQKIAHYISIISNGLHLLSEKDLQVQQEQDFEGDFLSMQTSVRKLVHMLNATLGEINMAADLVETGANQISTAAQGLSQGTTAQAASIETLSSTINKISAQVRDNADNAVKATNETNISEKEVTQCSEQMLKMNEAMNQINQRANEIGKIIKTIEDIAFQTNILALNAAVEAARAGAAGKGFAVVADEVRNLAAKSAEASKSTADLIEGTIKAVEDGGRISMDTQAALENVVLASRKVASVVTSMAAASDEQAKAIESVSDVVHQISSVVQTNSATAEESAAASEELSGQAQALKTLVSQFRLKEPVQTNSIAVAP